MARPTVLVVEDNPVTMKLVSVTLTGAGYDVVSAPDGDTALDVMAKGAPDLVLQDILLPDRDGMALVAELRKLPGGAELPIIAYSGFLSKSEEGRALAAGFTALLVKPVEPSRLLRAISFYLPLEGEKRENEETQEKAGAGLRVLVVDDDATQRKLIAFRLSEIGFRVELAAGGDAALEKALEDPPDAIASDLLMPAMNGFALCLAVRGDPALNRIPIVLFSSSPVAEDGRELAKNTGADRVVPRTHDMAVLIEALLDLTARKRNGSAPVHDRPTPRSPAPDTGKAFTHAHRFLKHLEQQAVTSTELIQTCTTQAAGLSVLSSVTDALSRSLEIDSALEDALSCCLEAGGVSAGAVFLADPDGGALRLRAASGFRDDQRDELARFFGQGRLLEEVVREGFAHALPRTPPASVDADLLSRAEARSALLFPLAVHGETLGALFMGSSRRDLTEPDWSHFARTVATQMAQAVSLAGSFARLRASEKRYRSLVEHANDAILSLDAQGKVLEANRRAEDLLGRPARDIVGSRFELIFRCDPRLLLEGRARVRDLEVKRPDGKTVFADVSAGRVETDGAPIVLAIVRDVTGRKRAMERLEKLYLEAADTARACEDFLGIASHELKKPLAALQAQVEAVLLDAHKAPFPAQDLGAALALVREKTLRLEKLVDALLDGSRIAAGRLKLRSEEIDLAGLAREVAARAKDDSDRAGSTIDVRSQGSVVGRWDRARLDVVLSNLLENAIKFGRGAPVSVEVSGDETLARVAVSDQGIGIEPERQARLFERADRTARAQGRGPGLSLWIVRQIVEAHSGKIRVASRPGKGSTFTVEIPRGP
ncbi:response regulator [bacterium]|nr:response regulator [bacterium]